jgi:hypothetical protein
MNEYPLAGAESGPAVALTEERRAHERVPVRYLAMCRAGGRAWWPVVFTDISPGGAAVALSSPVEADALLTFTVHAPQGRILLLRARALHVDFRDGEWVAGCRFDRVLSDLELADLL